MGGGKDETYLDMTACKSIPGRVPGDCNNLFTTNLLQF